MYTSINDITKVFNIVFSDDDYGHEKKIVEIFNGNIDQNEEDSRMLNYIGIYYYSQYYYDKSNNYFNRSADKGNGDGLFNLGKHYEEIEKDFVKARECYELLVERGCYNGAAALGMLYEQQFMDDTKAEQYYKKGIANDNVLSMLYYGLFKSNREQYDDAIMYYKMVLDKGDHRACGNLGFIYAFAYDDNETANKYFKEGIEKNDMGTLTMKIFTCYEQKKFEEIEQIINDTIMTNSLAAFTIGKYFEDNIDIKYNKRASKYYEFGASIGCAKSIYALAQLYKKRGKFRKAEKYYKMALTKIDSDCKLADDIYTEMNDIGKNIYIFI
jgi:TPR repeat protein